MEPHRHHSYGRRAATASKVTIRFLVGIVVVFFVACSSFPARLFTAGNSTVAAVDPARHANVQAAPPSPPRRSGQSTHRRDVLDGARSLCDVTTDPQHQLCRLVGDVRAVGGTNTVLYLSPAGQKRQANATTTWLIKAQSGRYIRDSERVRVTAVEARVVPQGRGSAPPPACTARCPSPAVVFTVSRHLRNLWHSFADVLVPLFATARAFDRRVQLVVTNGRRARWFAARFAPVLEALSAHDVVDFDADTEVRCYPRAIVGLHGRGNLAVDADGKNNTLLDFRAFLRSAYSLPPAAPALRVTAKPRLMLVDRHKTRKFVNTPEISAAVRRAGFELVTVEPRPSSGEGAAAGELSALARLADSCDVLVGAHGAGLAHLLFLRAGSVVVEVVPYDLAGAASTYRDFFERPSRVLQLRYVGYEARAEESTLLERYGAAHPVISDPAGVYRRGEAEGKPYAFRHYWNEQDIRLNVTRFGDVLAMGPTCHVAFFFPSLPPPPSFSPLLSLFSLPIPI